MIQSSKLFKDFSESRRLMRAYNHVIELAVEECKSTANPVKILKRITFCYQSGWYRDNSSLKPIGFRAFFQPAAVWYTGNKGGSTYANDRREDFDGMPAGAGGRYDLRLSRRHHSERL